MVSPTPMWEVPYIFLSVRIEPVGTTFLFRPMDTSAGQL